jgi:hypothetical protein
MATFFKNSRGKLIAIKSSIDKNGDTIFEADNSVKFIECTEWVELLFDEMANSGIFVTLAYEKISDRYKSKFSDSVMGPATPEVRASILEYMNQLRSESVTNGYENDDYYREEEFTDEDIEF